MKRRLVVLKSSTSALLPSQLVEQANAQLQRILGEHNPGEKLPSKIWAKLVSSIALKTSHQMALNQFLPAASPPVSLQQMPDNNNSNEWEENLQVE